MSKVTPLIGCDRNEADEVARFEELAERFWDPEGPMRPLHRMNPVRVAFIRDQVCRRFDRDARSLRPLAGLAVVDVGCGAGLLAEPLARLGGDVLGIDPAAANIDVAKRHAMAAGIAVDYRRTTAATLRREGRRFDVVVASEVIEHVEDQPGFVADLAALLRPGGLLVLSTLNRTARSLALGVVAAEYLLGWLPRGTHDWRRFLTPAMSARLLRRQGLLVDAIAGITYDPIEGTFRLSRDRSINYILAARRPA